FRPEFRDCANALESRELLAVSLPPGFVEYEVTGGISNPTAMDVAPDGRVFITEQGGSVRIVENGVLLPTPFVTVPVETTGERGLDGIVLDRDFEPNPSVYLYYTTAEAPIHNRVARVTAFGDVAVPGSLTTLLDLDPLPSWLHNGGAMRFGADGKLYVA